MGLRKIFGLYGRDFSRFYRHTARDKVTGKFSRRLHPLFLSPPLNVHPVYSRILMKSFPCLSRTPISVNLGRRGMENVLQRKASPLPLPPGPTRPEVYVFDAGLRAPASPGRPFSGGGQVFFPASVFGGGLFYVDFDCCGPGFCGSGAPCSTPRPGSFVEVRADSGPGHRSAPPVYFFGADAVTEESTTGSPGAPAPAPTAPGSSETRAESGPGSTDVSAPAVPQARGDEGPVTSRGGSATGPPSTPRSEVAGLTLGIG